MPPCLPRPGPAHHSLRIPPVPRVAGAASGAAMIAAFISLRASSPRGLRPARSQVRVEWARMTVPYAALPQRIAGASSHRVSSLCHRAGSTRPIAASTRSQHVDDSADTPSENKMSRRWSTVAAVVIASASAAKPFPNPTSTHPTVILRLSSMWRTSSATNTHYSIRTSLTANNYTEASPSACIRLRFGLGGVNTGLLH